MAELILGGEAGVKLAGASDDGEVVVRGRVVVVLDREAHVAQVQLEIIRNG